MRFRATALALIFLLPVIAGIAEGAAPTPFAKQAFADAQKAGEPIVVFVHATW